MAAAERSEVQRASSVPEGDGMLSPRRSTAIAHARDSGRTLHHLDEHLREVGTLASGFAARFNSEVWGQAAGRLHDLGKFAADFQKMIRQATGVDPHLGDGTEGARIDHSSAGARHVWNTLGKGQGWPLAAVIAGHHCGLVDHVDLEQRLSIKQERLDAAMQGQPPQDLLKVPSSGVPAVVAGLRGEAQRLAAELWTRFLFSALVDADSLDTERFMQPEQYASRQGFRPLGTQLNALESSLRLRSGLGKPALDAARRSVQEAAREKARLPRGVFSLTVPTGGGKTFASALFALTHALHHDLERVIMVPPFTSIIEQNANALREAGLEVLEHHSALDPDSEIPRHALAAENWDATFIVTTAVQFLESLFSNRRSRCRKLHRVARSVIVLDEAQSLPIDYLPPILDILGALVRDYGCTLVLCTATQPALKKRSNLPRGFDPIVEIAPDPTGLAKTLERVEVQWPLASEPTSWPALAQEAVQHQQVLCITHRTADARELALALDHAAPEAQSVHLSARMCPAHRAEVLADVRKSLSGGRPIRVVSTQLIEAGVDVDFPVVYRAMAGLDSLAQAAGRCNREGKRERGLFRVFNAESSPPLGTPKTGLSVARAMLQEEPTLDLFAPATFERFFERLYADGVTDHGVQGMRKEWKFKSVAETFKLIDDTIAVVVPYGHVTDDFDRLLTAEPSRAELRRLQRFTVGLSTWQFGRLKNSGALCDLLGKVPALARSHWGLYDHRFGLELDGPLAADPEAYLT